MARVAGLKELEDLRARQKSEALSDLESPSSMLVSKESPKQKNMQAMLPEIPIKLPLSRSQFKDQITKVRIKSEPMIIDGIEHLGIIHDVSLTREPRVYRFCGDRYTARVHLSPECFSLLDMKEVTQRKLFLTKLF